jgi:hypothetical protein
MPVWTPSHLGVKVKKKSTTSTGVVGEPTASGELVPRTGCLLDCHMRPITLTGDHRETQAEFGAYGTAQGPSQPRHYHWRTIGMARPTPVGRANARAPAVA